MRFICLLAARAQDFATMMLPISLVFIFYALRTYLVRSTKIKTRDAERWDDPYGPVLLTLMVILVLVVQFTVKVVDLIV